MNRLPSKALLRFALPMVAAGFLAQSLLPCQLSNILNAPALAISPNECTR